MLSSSALAVTALLSFPAVFAAPTTRASAPSVLLDNGTFIGATSSGVSKFLGIPFAQAPVGNLRFQLPQPIPAYTGTKTVTSFGAACYQQAIDLPLGSGIGADAIDYVVNSIYGDIFPDAEDCLFINVWTPSNVKPGAKLPVIAWIFGGGFELGSPSIYDGGGIVGRSIDLGTPVVYVSMNYRVSGLGFMASKEIKAAGVGNLGLQDQRQALRWVQKYITQFGGDPAKVTLWGESAGAISAALQMVTNGGNTGGLFRGAFMESGSPIPVGDISHGQKYYDAVVSLVGCSSASDTLACLRSVSYAKLTAAIDKSPGIFSYQSLNLAWTPRVDGVFLTQSPQALVAAGSVARIPYVTGDCDDEGTLFSLAQSNVTTNADFLSYVKNVYIPGATDAEVAGVASAYPNDITAGSPFGTGILDSLYPQFKRLAAFQGDLVFQAPRRYFLSQTAALQNTWAFLYKRGKILPFLGTAHATDILNSYGTGELRDYVINFAVTLTPDGSNWPKWTKASPNILLLQDDIFNPVTLVQDTYRADAMNVLTALSLKYPL